MDALNPIFLVLIVAAGLAGMIDAVVGGGGLVQIPALFTAFPGQDPATLFGTNKCASIFGTGNAAWRYSRRIVLPWRTILPAALAAFLLSYAGAAVTQVGIGVEQAGDIDFIADRFAHRGFVVQHLLFWDRCRRSTLQVGPGLLF